MSFEIYGPDPTVLDTSGRKPHVLIIGAGLAGLTLGIMLQKAGIPFDIFEKLPEARAVGSALFLAPQVHPILEDLGIFDQYLHHSNLCTTINFFNQDIQPESKLDFQLYNELTTCEGRVIPHEKLHAILLSQIPSSRIHTSKRLLWFTQGENGVQVRFSDSKTFDGDILYPSNPIFGSDGVAIETITTQVRDFLIPCPLKANIGISNSHGDSNKTKVTMGDLIDKTPRDKIAKVVVEGRMFETWYYCRTILIGDDKKGASNGGGGSARGLKAPSGSTVSLDDEKDDEDDEKGIVKAVRSISFEDDDRDEDDLEGDYDDEDGDYDDDGDDESRDGKSSTSSDQQLTTIIAVSPDNYSTTKNHKQTLEK
ncbi:hypothetical protein KI688_004215 [Linnemannia hyalina]|uniref:FAD-binding domain-containing protein n=1 Tax=Linnemannia hyalina TaxID=64524 RepID=A0A9P7XMP9_9FUNG|nr:hypothetical protein KI688_004215 [Linnemannia hyalina]